MFAFAPCFSASEGEAWVDYDRDAFFVWKAEVLEQVLSSNYRRLSDFRADDR